MPEPVPSQKAGEVALTICLFPLRELYVVREVPNQWNVSSSSMFFQPWESNMKRIIESNSNQNLILAAHISALNRPIAVAHSQMTPKGAGTKGLAPALAMFCSTCCHILLIGPQMMEPGWQSGVRIWNRNPFKDNSTQSSVPWSMPWSMIWQWTSLPNFRAMSSLACWCFWKHLGQEYPLVKDSRRSSSDSCCPVRVYRVYRWFINVNVKVNCLNSTNSPQNQNWFITIWFVWWSAHTDKSAKPNANDILQLQPRMF